MQARWKKAFAFIWRHHWAVGSYSSSAQIDVHRTYHYFERPLVLYAFALANFLFLHAHCADSAWEWIMVSFGRTLFSSQQGVGTSFQTCLFIFGVNNGAMPSWVLIYMRVRLGARARWFSQSLSDTKPGASVTETNILTYMGGYEVVPHTPHEHHHFDRISGHRPKRDFSSFLSFFLE